MFPMQKPVRPSKVIAHTVPVYEHNGNYDTIDLKNIKADSLYVEATTEREYGDDVVKVCLRFYNCEDRPNPNYKSELARYKRDMKHYEEELAKWLKKEAKEKKKLERIAKLNRAKLYYQLKEEFENEHSRSTKNSSK